MSRLLLMASLSLGLSACGGEPPADGRGEAGDEATEGAPAANRDACRLLTEAEVEAAVGQPVVARGGEKGSNTTTCEWLVGDQPMLQLDVTWTGGREEWQTWEAAFGLAANLMAETEADRPMVDSIVKPGAVEGLGDQAWFSDIMPSFVLRDDVLLTFNLQLVPESRAQFVPLSRKALSRM